MLSLLLLSLAAQPGFDTKAAIRVLDPHGNTLAGCFDLPDEPPVNSTIIVALNVGPSGHLTREPRVIKTTANAPAIQACLVSRLMALHLEFPESPDLERNVVLVQLTLKPDQRVGFAVDVVRALPLRTVQERLADRTWIELWADGGTIMFVIAAMLAVLLAVGMLACAIAVARRARTAVVLAGLCWGLAGCSAAVGAYGYFDSMAVASRVVPHLSIDEREPVALQSFAEAQIPLRFGGGSGALGMLLGALAVTLAVRTSNRSVSHV